MPPARAKEKPVQISNSACMGMEALVCLAAYKPDRPCTAQALAEWINRSMTHTETLISRLRGWSCEGESGIGRGLSPKQAS